ncbi:ABC transporter substrate-binding protein [Aestuariispira ectoiniformans]|uniref:ABC transporter substrate-binding protein n=1 Tax=Aestuariispira ectoiniformans TaxID=2775080 RepID=UPI00223C1361|nr:ABC transporter substrate-binding protein [Aestuariispira ectoiniformans]
MFEINRRQLLAGTAAASLALGTGLGFAPKAQAAEPKKGGHFRLALSGGATADSMDPATYAAGPVVFAALAICNNLTEVDENGNAIPELAESWEASGDAKTWTFKLRQGIKFHNGKVMTSEDVIASFNHHRGKDSKSGAKSLLAGIKDIRADGDSAVVFELAEGNADFPFVPADYHLEIFPSADGKIDWKSGIGTGGYMLESFEPGVRTVLKRNPDYWKQGRANFDTVEILTINDPAARVSALMTGGVDAVNSLDLKTVHLLKRNKNIVVEEVTGTSHYTLPMFADTAPFNDNNVRMALKHAIDREQLVETILRGHGRPGNDSPITPANRYFNTDLPQRAYDADKAKYYLKQAGMSDLKVDLHTSDAAFSGAVDTAVLFRESAAKAGIDINVVREPADGYWSNVWLKKAFCMSYWNGRPTEDWMFSLVYAGGADWNDGHWNNERFNKLLVEARAELDEAKRKAMYFEMQELVYNDGSTIIPMYANYVDGRSAKIARGNLASNRFLDGWKCIERWWMA